MIYRIAPKYGRRSPVVYLSICSMVGSISIMAIKAFGIALKLTLRGDNQFTHASTYVFIVVVAVCILTQMNYFNKALSQFSTNMYVPFSFQLSPFAFNTDSIKCQSTILRLVHQCYHFGVAHPVWRLQYHRCGQHTLPFMWIPRYLYGCLPSEHVQRRSRGH